MGGAAGYDVIVLGGGAPGEHCAGALAEGGLRVAVVERELAGGECSYYACIPSKTLLRPGEAALAARDAAAHAEVDVEAALAWRDAMVWGYSDASQERWLADRGIELVRGTGRLAGTRAVRVNGRTYLGNHVVIATGADPVVPPVPGLRGLEGLWGTCEATSMKAIPRRLLVLGGGPAGVELAQIVRRLGGEAVVVERAERLLPREPACLGEGLGNALREDGIELMLGTRVVGVRSADGEYVLTLDDGRDLRGDRLLVATGRRPRVDGIGLETVGIDPDPSGIAVDAHLRAGERLWAIGDVTGIWPLTSVGEYQGDIVAANILGDPRRANYDAVPRVTFTDPQAAAAGVTQDRYSATVSLAEESKLATYTPLARPLERLFDSPQQRRAAHGGVCALVPKRGNGCSRPRSRSELASRSRCSGTRFSRSRASRGSTGQRSMRSSVRSRAALRGPYRVAHLQKLSRLLSAGQAPWLCSSPQSR